MALPAYTPTSCRHEDLLYILRVLFKAEAGRLQYQETTFHESLATQLHQAFQGSAVEVLDPHFVYNTKSSQPSNKKLYKSPKLELPPWESFSNLVALVGLLEHLRIVTTAAAHFFTG
jgi:hypothetical protein